MNKPGLEQISKAESLQDLNGILTALMNKNKIQPLIRDEGLSVVINAIKDLASDADEQDTLFSAAMLGRLAAVARHRRSEVYSRIPDLIQEELPSIEELSASEEKEYAAKVLAYVKSPWLLKYCAREAMAIDTAEKARKELVRVILLKTGNLSDSIRTLNEASKSLGLIESLDSRAKRAKRIFVSLAEVVRDFDGDVGQEPGSALGSSVHCFFRGLNEADVEALHDGMDAILSIIVRIIQLRFSHALTSEIYQPLQDGKKALTPGYWNRFITDSRLIHKVQINLMETALVLARQNRTDKEILRIMETSWTSLSSITEAMKHHFSEAADIDPEVADYWLKVGRVSQRERSVEHKLGNTEDQQIGELLIQLDANRECMSKLNSAVVPVLKTFDPYQSATVQRAAIGYESIAQVAERIARMRRLSKTELLGSIVEYNPIEHDMEGGHRSGVRKVKVVRDGILKEFGGKKKTLVKPRVEPED